MRRWWQHIARRLGRDRNPLRRRVDRAEAIALNSLLIAFVIGAPLTAVVAGRAADAAGLRAQKSERTWYHRQAVVLASPVQQFGTSGMLSTAWVPARWTLSDGQPRSGVIITGIDARRGQRVEIWLTPAGQLTRPPLTSADVYDRVAFAALLAIMSTATVLGIIAAVVRLLSNRRRMAGWHKAWDAVGPLWSRRR